MLKTALKIVRKLNEAGHTAYFAGGVVRDTLLDRKISDIDIATSARPEDVEKLFPQTHPIGKEFGVILVVSSRHTFEVATFRGESDYDGRRPGKVFFTSAEADARRRDFTINGLFYDPLKKKVLDFVNGQHDLKLKVVRAIGNPAERLQEDYLRILRGVRLKNMLGFEYEPATATALKKYSVLIQKISAERIAAELNRMLANEHRANAVRDLDRLGLLAILLPDLTRLKHLPQPKKYHREGDTFTHTLGSLASLPKKVSLAVSWATLCHDLGKAETFQDKDGEISFHGHAEISAQLAKKILKGLRLDNATIAKTSWLAGHHMILGDIPKMRPAHRHRFLTHPWFPDLLQVCRADIRGTRPADLSLLRQVVKIWRAETQRKLLLPPKEFLTGSEIMAELKVPAGPEIGRLKQALQDAMIEGQVQTRAEAVEFLEKCLKR